MKSRSRIDNRFKSVNGIMIMIQPEAKTNFGRWTIIGPKFLVKHLAQVAVQCSCGTISVVGYASLKVGTSTSCGCFAKEEMARIHTIHGCARTGAMTDEYHIWSGMNNRCSNPNYREYHKYGGRGIRVCDQWKHDFPKFLKDVGPRPSREYSIDRFPNTNGNYEPGNVRWATVLQQNNNRRSSYMVEFRGRTQSIQDWARELGVVSGNTAWQRLRRGWSVEDALTLTSHWSQLGVRKQLAQSQEVLDA